LLKWTDNIRRGTGHEMSFMKRFLLLVALLVVSLGINIFFAFLLLVQADPNKRTSECPSAGDRVDVPGRSRTADPALHANMARCPQKLKQCEAMAWQMVAEAIRQREHGPASRPAAAGQEAAAPTVAPSTSDEQRRFRLALAVDHVQRRWRQDRAEIIAGVARDLADPQKQTHKLRTEVERFADALGLSASELDLLHQRYGPIRRDHLRRLRQAIVADPVDYLKALEILRELYRAEDQLVLDIFGVEARLRLRASQLRSRTAIVAIAATFAGLGWDDERLSW
jgi:hypothetical protein